ncbi:MAG: hypothetical protein ACK4WH_04100 [Phycisphaerales bacterium]
MPIERFEPLLGSRPSASLDLGVTVSRLVADLPADQALGLRLLGMARAAAALHTSHAADDLLSRSQAAQLLQQVRS